MSEDKPPFDRPVTEDEAMLYDWIGERDDIWELLLFLAKQHEMGMPKHIQDIISRIKANMVYCD